MRGTSARSLARPLGVKIACAASSFIRIA